MVPTVGLSSHVTPPLEAPPTVAVSCWVWEAVRVAESGVSEMLTWGVSVTVALAYLVGSATLVAFTVTVCAAAMLAGAVYRPAAEIVPTFGLSVHVTALLEVPPTVAVYCWVWEPASVAESGVNEIVTGGLSVTVALADLVGSATLVAFTVTVCAAEMVAGAV